MFDGRLIRIRCLIVCRFGQCVDSYATRRGIDQFFQVARADFTANDLVYLLITNERFESVVGVRAGKQNSDRVRRAFFRFTKRVKSAHARKILSRDDDMNRGIAKRI